MPQEMMKKNNIHQLNLPHQLSKPYIKNNSIYLIFVSIFMLINVTLFITRAIQYRKSNFSVIFARACGELLKASKKIFKRAFFFVRTMSELRLRVCAGFDAASDADISENARLGRDFPARPAHLLAQAYGMDDCVVGIVPHRHARHKFQ